MTSRKILNLDNPIKLTNDLQKNVLIIKRKYGRKFKIQFDENTLIPVILYQVDYPHNPKVKYYSLIYDITDREDYLFPFKIDFYDVVNLENNNNCYIANIHKTATISGTQMVNFVIKLLVVLRANKVYLNDGARIDCDNTTIDLSFYKLIERGGTFYQKFGFKFIANETWHRLNYGTSQNMNHVMLESLRKFKKIKLSYLNAAYEQILDILFAVIRNQDYDNLKIYLGHPTFPYIIRKQNTFNTVNEIVQEINYILSKTKTSERKYLYQLMIDLMKTSCQDYKRIEEFIINNQVYGVKYHRRKILLKHNYIFDDIKIIRNSTVELDLTKD